MSLSKDPVLEFEAVPKEYNLRHWTTKDALDRYLNKGYTYPFVIVICWTDCTAAVACPYCQHIHRHGCVPPNQHDLTSRASHCGYQPELFLQYTILFPFSEHPGAARAGLCFEIDKVNKRFKTIGVDAEEAIEDSINDFEDAFRASAITDNEDEEDENEDEGNKKEGRVKFTKKMKQRPIFLEDENEDEGNKKEGRVKFTKKMKQRPIILEDDEDAINFVSFCVSNKLRWARIVYEQSPQQQQSKLLNEKNRAGDTTVHDRYGRT